MGAAMAGILGIIYALSIPIGLVSCFFGYKVFRFLLGLTGFIVGAAAGAAIASAIGSGSFMTIVIGLIGGLIGAGLAVFLFFLGLFMLGAFVFGSIGGLIFHSSTAAIILGVLGGIAAVLIQKLMIMISTAYGGASTVVSAIAGFSHLRYMSIEDFLQPFRYARHAVGAQLAGIIILGTAGLLVQIGLIRAQARRGETQPANVLIRRPGGP
jgi:hypothetical protein